MAEELKEAQNCSADAVEVFIHSHNGVADMASCSGKDEKQPPISGNCKLGACAQGNGKAAATAATAAIAASETAGDGAENSGGSTPTTSAASPLPPWRQWWRECEPYVALLREALLSSTPDVAVLGPLDGCYTFYLNHLHNKILSSSYARTMIFGAQLTRLESAFCWLGSWRPTAALVLVYSLMGMEIENAMQAARLGRDAGIDSSAESSARTARQLSVMRTLQTQTQRAELRISKKVTALQMLLGDQDMLRAVLLDAASTITNDSSRFDRAVEKRLSRLRKLLVQAENLRLHTLNDLLLLLTPVQAARCGVTIFEVCSSLRALGHHHGSTSPALPSLQAVAAHLTLPSDRSSDSTSVPAADSTTDAADLSPLSTSACESTAQPLRQSSRPSDGERNIGMSASTLTVITEATAIVSTIGSFANE